MIFFRSHRRRVLISTPPGPAAAAAPSPPVRACVVRTEDPGQPGTVLWRRAWRDPSADPGLPVRAVLARAADPAFPALARWRRVAADSPLPAVHPPRGLVARQVRDEREHTAGAALWRRYDQAILVGLWRPPVLLAAETADRTALVAWGRPGALFSAGAGYGIAADPQSAAAGDLLAAIVARFSSSADLTRAFPGGLWIDEAPPGTVMPFAVLFDLSEELEYSSLGDDALVPYLERVEVPIQIVAPSKAQARGLAEVLDAALSDAALAIIDGTVLELRRSRQLSRKSTRLGPSAAGCWEETVTFLALVQRSFDSPLF